jgi:GNAT superfamily N-acetyltransferase
VKFKFFLLKFIERSENFSPVTVLLFPAFTYILTLLKIPQFPISNRDCLCTYRELPDLVIQIVRNSVKENTLSNPDLVTDKDCEAFITVRGKGWVFEIENQIVGFAIVDLKGNNIWALFLDPKFERKGIGQILHKTMLDWYFTQTKEKVWLGTAFDTRAEKFYRKAGWKEVGTNGTKEIKFEMTFNNWTTSQHR